MEVSIKVEKNGSTVKLVVMVESHPAIVNKLFMYVPLVETMEPSGKI